MSPDSLPHPTVYHHVGTAHSVYQAHRSADVCCLRRLVPANDVTDFFDSAYGFSIIAPGYSPPTEQADPARLYPGEVSVHSCCSQRCAVLHACTV